MAYGEEVAWSEFGYPDYLFRLKDLIQEWSEGFSLVPGEHPDEPEQSRWDGDPQALERCEKAIEETALEFVVYNKQLEHRSADQ